MASAALSASAKLALRLERKLIIDEMRRTTALKPVVAQTTPWWTHLEHPAGQISTPAVDVYALLGVRSGASAFELRSALSAVAQESGASSSFVAARTAYEFLAARDLHKQGGPGLVSDCGESSFAPVFRGAAAGTPPFAVDRRLASFPSGGVFGLVNAILGARRLLSSAVAAPEKESSLMALALL
mmetsp:Transcript_84954/g.243811  ORF Transcript_84954/g.243811 Transcript_84954/m.243811 type:complete len:185 (-) Transcript_84954:339-893(-)|eukprot:CAMPEP_0177192670 /NCGR_PEP_ID=MMETSP0367-20130122/22027_1 /TAXON_ID=447022 ORGANISM="Scrippsiella hangoei-like, Strain SHHI-4" /NCGR_SAMPLE_ID=MMETSP0367 /ASSEMBLY_ACC=CAM_ASM_000362 /LENGTH=184 /DNA_ID=CAMNT_0018640493 /DNA_START=90 /DNA_END=644 /DNA_ORIENTATION=+